MVTPAFPLPGHRIAPSLGVVRGLTVRSRQMISTHYDATALVAGLTGAPCVGTAVVVAPRQNMSVHDGPLA